MRLPLRFAIRLPRRDYSTPGHLEALAHEVELTAEGDIRIGRAADAEIELPFPRVSARHARIFRAGDGHRVEDLGSSNGTRLRGRRLAPHVPEAFAVGDCLEIGEVEIHFTSQGTERAGPPPGAGTDTLARRLVHDLFESCPPAERARLLVVSGPDAGRELLLSGGGQPLRIGRGSGCDLVLSDEDVSREHATIERRPGGLVVCDLGSKNGVEVAGERMVGERLLRDGDVLRLGETVLRVADPEDRYLRQMESAPDDASPSPSGAADGRERRPGDDAAPALRPSSQPADVRPSRLPTIASLIAGTALVLALGVVLALALGLHP